MSNWLVYVQLELYICTLTASLSSHSTDESSASTQLLCLLFCFLNGKIQDSDLIAITVTFILILLQTKGWRLDEIGAGYLIISLLSGPEMNFHDRRKWRGEEEKDKRRPSPSSRDRYRDRDRRGHASRPRYSENSRSSTDRLRDRSERAGAGSRGAKEDESRRKIKTERGESPPRKEEKPRQMTEEEGRALSTEIQAEQRKLDEVSKVLVQLMRNSQPDLDLIGKKTDERKKVLKSLKKLRKEGYKRETWKSQSASEVLINIKSSVNVKGSFIIDDIFKSLEHTKEHFGKFGTIALCEDLKVSSGPRKVKLEYFNKSDAHNTLTARHPPGINFYIDPFPELETKPQAAGSIAREEAPKRSEVPPPTHQAWNLPTIKTEPEPDRMINSKDVTQNKNVRINVSNYRQFLRTENDIYSYFKRFGDIVNIKNQDGSDVRDDDLEERDLIIDFISGESALSAVRYSHRRGLRVTGGQETLAQAERFPVTGVQRNYDHQKTGDGLDRKQCAVPRAHRHENWICSQRSCNYVNSPREMYRCRQCQTTRPGNWECDKCGEVNTPDSLACSRHSCRAIRRGNWECPQCRHLNWGRSIHCYAASCHQAIPGSWSCTACSTLNFRDRRCCFSCGQSSSTVHRTHNSKHFEIAAEQAKKRQALENIKNLNNSDRSETLRTRREETRDWSQQFSEMRSAKQRKLAEENAKAQVVQNRLLALVGEEVTKDSSLGGLANSGELPTQNNNQNANLEPVVATARKSKMELLKEHVGVIDDRMVEKIRSGSQAEKQNILKQFNIVEIAPPKPQRKVVEVSLLDDSDEDLGKYSDGDGSMNEDDDEEDIQVIGGQPGRVVAGPGESERSGSTDGARSHREREDEDEIVIM